MPIEIRELVVRVQVDPSASTSPPSLSEEHLNQLKSDLIQRCLAELRREQADREER